MSFNIEILMATHNGERYIGEQIESILNQTNQDWKLIIHDDGSDDSTIILVKEYVSRFPNKITLIEDDIKTGGAKNNFTHLMNLSTAEYIMFSDQDDVWNADKVEKTFNKMKIEERDIGVEKAILIFSDLTVVDENLNIISKSMWKLQKVSPEFCNNIYRLATCNVVTGCTIMMNKTALSMSMIIKEAIMHDWWIALQILKKNGKLSYIKDPLILYRQHKNNEVGVKRIRNIGKIIELNIKNYLMLKELGIFNIFFYFIFSKIKTILIRLKIND